MKESETREKRVTRDVKNSSLKVSDGVSVCITLDKHGMQADIIVVSDGGAKSVRSVTELLNVLIKEHNVPQDKVVEEVIPWVEGRIAFLRGKRWLYES